MRKRTAIATLRHLASFAIVATTVVVWLRSYRVMDVLAFRSRDQYGVVNQPITLWIASLRGDVIIEACRYGPEWRSARVAVVRKYDCGHLSQPVTGGVADLVESDYGHNGFIAREVWDEGWSHHGFGHHARSVKLHWWHLVIFFSVVPAMLATRRRIIRLRSAPRGESCPTCGYDLRATPTRCPECGKQIKASERKGDREIKRDVGKF